MNQCGRCQKDELEATQEEPQEEDGGRDLADGIVRLDKYGPEAVLTVAGLAALLGRTGSSSVLGAVSRGELPRPVKLCGVKYWLRETITEHLQQRARKTQAEADKDAARLQKLGVMR